MSEMHVQMGPARYTTERDELVFAVRAVISFLFHRVVGINLSQLANISFVENDRSHTVFSASDSWSSCSLSIISLLNGDVPVDIETRPEGFPDALNK